MYVDQELFDETLKIRSQGGSSPNVISTAEQLAGSPSWDNEDGKVPTAGAAASRFDQVVGNGTSYPGTGNKGQRGKIRIDNTVTPQKMFWWDESLSTPGSRSRRKARRVIPVHRVQREIKEIRAIPAKTALAQAPLPRFRVVLALTQTRTVPLQH